MLKSRNDGSDVPPVPRQRLRRLRESLRRYKRLFAVSSSLVVVLSILLFGFVWADGPEPVPLGVGQAGIMDTIEVEVPGADTTATLPPDGDVIDELPEGAASYYGDELAGRPTASGETFDPDRLTAAHRTLPFGTRLRVTHVGNGRSVVVKVNDRGPFTRGRVLDLSFAAAQKIGMIGGGTARVRMQVLE